MGDNIAGPSLLLARQDLAHREHLHQHNHNHLHRRQATAVVTEIVATVSVVQQVDVDRNGNTWSIETLTTESTPPAITTENAATTSTEGPAVAIPGAGSAVGEGSQPSQSLLSDHSTTSASTPISIPTHFPTLILSSNSTSLISSISNSSRFANSTTSSRTSLTYRTSSSVSDDLRESSTSVFYTPSYTATSAGVVGGNAGGTGVAGGTASTSTAASGNGTSNSSTASPPVIVGGVVGSVAGVAILIFVLMGLIRWWKKKHQSMLLLGDGDGDAGTGAEMTRDGPPSQPLGGMSERRSLAFGVPAVLASMTGYKRASQKTETDRTISSTAGSERGFYRVSGRKLPSVLQSGGDGYGGGIDTNTLSGSSFYRDSQGFYGGAGSPTSPSLPPGARSFQRDSGVPVMRPSPARTPVTEQSPFSAFPAPLDPPARRPDVLARSPPSQDGSQRSRFTEVV
ncbi:hypothetical protein N431DRAFT_543950 [Stipitochalara longipes BDJ]|nr:hypothetical protein N431DRAFT_543950 [Stipitochalara longipes BDJ]